MGVLIEEVDDIIVIGTSNMQKCELSIILQHFKWKVVELIQTLPNPFQNGLFLNSWCYYCRHLQLTIYLIRTKSKHGTRFNQQFVQLILLKFSSIVCPIVI